MNKSNSKFRSSRQRLTYITLCLVVSGFVFTACQSAAPKPAPPTSRTKNADVVNVVNKQDSDNVVASLRTIRNAQTTCYSQTNGRYGTFDQLVRNQFLPRSFAGERPTVRGYTFTLKFTQINGDYDTGAAYTVNADPVEGKGQHFFLDKQHVIHYQDRQAASETDPVFEEGH